MMLADVRPETLQLPEHAHAELGRRRRRPNLPRRGARVLAFVAGLAVVLAYALRGGGSYDLVTFEEYGLVIWFVLALGFALGLLPRARPAREMLLLFAALAAYAGWTALSLLWTQSSELTTVEVARTLDYLGLVALAGMAVDRNTWRMAGAGLGFGALVVCVLAVGSRLAPSLFGVDNVDAFLHTDRLSRPFGYWNAVAAWGAMCIALALTWSAHDTSRIRRAVALGLVPVAGATVYLTYSRAGVFGAGVAVVVAIAFSRNRITAAIHAGIAGAGSAIVIVAIRGAPQIAHATGTKGAGGVLGGVVFGCALCAVAGFLTGFVGADRWRIPRSLQRPLMAVGVLVVLAAGVAVGPHLASRAWHSFTRTPAPALSANPTSRLNSLSGSRYQVWKAAFKEFKAHPIDGTGAGTFEFTWNQRGTTGEFVRDTHNIWLQNMSELGLPGLLLIVAIAAAALWLGIAVRVRARRSVSAGAAGAFVAVMLVYLLHASVDWMWESTAVTVFALAGVAIVGARLSGRPLRLAVAVRALLVALSAGAAIVQLPGILSTQDIRRSQSAIRSGDVGGALVLARDAVSAEPWSASAHEQEALVLEAQGELSQAKTQESLAVSHEPTNYTHYLIRSRIETELGTLRVAVRDYQRARQLRPRAEVFVLAPYFAGAPGPAAILR
jgi:hypothetical protein